MDLGQFKRDVRSGNLVQCCIQIESRNRKMESLDFLRKYGLLDGDGTVISDDEA